MLDKPQEANYTAPSCAPEPYVFRTPAKTRSTWKPRRAHPAGVRARIAQHLLAPAAAIWHNRQINVPSSDRLSPTTTDQLGITHLLAAGAGPPAIELPEQSRGCGCGGELSSRGERDLPGRRPHGGQPTASHGPTRESRKNAEGETRDSAG